MLAWDTPVAPPRLVLGEPRGGTGGGTLCFWEPLSTAGKATSGSETAIFGAAGASLAAVETGEVTDVDVIWAVTSVKDTEGYRNTRDDCIDLLSFFYIK